MVIKITIRSDQIYLFTAAIVDVPLLIRCRLLTFFVGSDGMLLLVDLKNPSGNKIVPLTLEEIVREFLVVRDQILGNNYVLVVSFEKC